MGSLGEPMGGGIMYAWKPACRQRMAKASKSDCHVRQRQDFGCSSCPSFGDCIGGGGVGSSTLHQHTALGRLLNLLHGSALNAECCHWHAAISLEMELSE